MSTNVNKNIAYLAIIFIAVIIAAIVYFLSTRVPYSQEYQGVFLTNGQVYFGKVTTTIPQLVIEDVYYLKLNGLASASLESIQPNQFEVIKLGNEIHGPTNKMWINPEQVLFTVDLKPESEVVAKIKALQR